MVDGCHCDKPVCRGEVLTAGVQQALRLLLSCLAISQTSSGLSLHVNGCALALCTLNGATE